MTTHRHTPDLLRAAAETARTSAELPSRIREPLADWLALESRRVEPAVTTGRAAIFARALLAEKDPS
jgi:hypothetical protein